MSTSFFIHSRLEDKGHTDNLGTKKPEQLITSRCIANKGHFDNHITLFKFRYYLDMK